MAKDGRARAETSLRSKAATITSVLALAGLLVGALFGDRGVFYLMAQKQKAAALEQEVEALRAENGRLASEIEALRRDPRSIEKLAREQLGLARPGETVFLIREEPIR
jgi:cell division protein FtsB